MQIFSEYSLWLFPICMLVGLALAFLLYRKDSKLSDAPLWVRRLLFCLRTFVVTFLLFLLLGPFVEMRKKQIEKPVVVIAHDNSASLVLQKDSLFYKTKYLSDYQSFVSDLSKEYDVEEYYFGGEISEDSTLTFSEHETNISGALREIAMRYYHKNVGALVLASDGIFNAGVNPKYATQDFPAQMPIYTVALGDTVQECDNVISKVLHNQIAFRDNPFSVKVSVESHALQGKTSKLLIKEGDKTIFETSFYSNSEHVLKTIDCKLQCGEIGKKVYTVCLEYFDGEISELNNSYSFAVDILESRQKIVLLYDAVHPDVGAIRRAIESNKNYECQVVSISDDAIPDARDCNCMILIGLPNSYGKGKSILNTALQSGIPCFLVYNSNMSLDNLNSHNLGFSIDGFRRSFDEVKINVESDFSLFSLDESSKYFLSQTPPLIVPYGSYKLGVQTKIMASQKIGDIAVDRPLIAFSQVQNTKVGMIFGEGLWRWRLFDYKLNGSFQAFDSFINKMIAYLALTEKREMFVVSGESIIYDNQSASFTAELYDKVYEPIPNQEISMKITSEDGMEYPFAFSSSDNFYTLNAGKFPEGKYLYQAFVEIDGNKYVKNGSFYVLPLQSEFKQTCANHELLRDLSKQSNGKLFYPNELQNLRDEIQNNPNIVAVSHMTRNRTAAVDIPLILIFVIVAAAVEWFLRKYYATY